MTHRGVRLLASWMALFTPALQGQDQDADVLDRQLVMQQLEKDAEALGDIAAGLVPPDTLVKRARSLAKGAKEARDSFKTNVPGGAAKPEVWNNWTDFSRRMEDFVTNSEKLAKVSETGNVVAVTELLIDALPCKQCHDIYRISKPKS